MYSGEASDNKVEHMMGPAAWPWEPLLPAKSIKEQIE
jgi:hypothetical protein